MPPAQLLSVGPNPDTIYNSRETYNNTDGGLTGAVNDKVSTMEPFMNHRHRRRRRRPSTVATVVCCYLALSSSLSSSTRAEAASASSAVETVNTPPSKSDIGLPLPSSDRRGRRRRRLGEHPLFHAQNVASQQQQQNRKLQQQPEELYCPPTHNGYHPTPTCQHYYWCSSTRHWDGSYTSSVTSAILYECGEGLLFSVDKGICDWEESVDCSFLVEMIDVGGVGDENGESDTTTAASSGGGEPFNESGVHAKSSPQQATTLNSDEVVNINTESLIQPIEETGSTESMQSTKEASTEFQQKKTAHNKSIIGYLSLERAIQLRRWNEQYESNFNRRRGVDYVVWSNFQYLGGGSGYQIGLWIG
eukprot:scaffold3067_cov259-Alexandrium_tamarense.AAC.3